MRTNLVPPSLVVALGYSMWEKLIFALGRFFCLFAEEDLGLLTTPQFLCGEGDFFCLREGITEIQEKR